MIPNKARRSIVVSEDLEKQTLGPPAMVDGMVAGMKAMAGGRGIDDTVGTARINVGLNVAAVETPPETASDVTRAGVANDTSLECVNVSC